MFDNLSKKIGAAAQSAAKKSGEVVEITKLNLNINAEEESIKKLYIELGKYCFDKYNSNTEGDETILELCTKIKTHKENIDTLNQKISEIKSTEK
ncbi:hypothetical protein QBE51_08565 [Defluviitalea saccharophila]|jgi:hypothetical protein|uniref:Uncharacterized protein n=2 Tax=Defluviitalea saccharophila TaxID=879970 RepID=A0ABZ2YA56_9FIRM